MTTKAREFEIFLAHSSGDKEYVRAIYQLLVLDGFCPWLDEINLVPGQDWELEIANAVERSAAIAVFLSESAVSQEGYFHKEIASALQRAQRQPEGSIAIIPIRLDSAEPPRSLRHLHWIDVSDVDRPVFLQKIRYMLELDPLIEGFMIGESYLRLRHALLHRAQQVGQSDFPAPNLFNSWYTGKSYWPHLQKHYLVHGRGPNGNTYFGKAEINNEGHEYSFEMRSGIGAEQHNYTGTFEFPKLQFTGAHNVFYVPSGNGLLIGSWDRGGLEELIPALDMTKEA